MAEIVGTPENDVLRDGDTAPLFFAGGDILRPGDFDNDILRGLDGDDTFRGSYGDDTFVGGPGDDLIFKEQPRSTLLGGGDNDRLDLAFNSRMAEYQISFLTPGSGWIDAVDVPNNDEADGGRGNDMVLSGWGRDVLEGGDGFDLLVLPVRFPDFPRVTNLAGPGFTERNIELNRGNLVVDLQVGTAEYNGAIMSVELAQPEFFNDERVVPREVVFTGTAEGVGGYSHLATGFEAVVGHTADVSIFRGTDRTDVTEVFDRGSVEDDGTAGRFNGRGGIDAVSYGLLLVGGVNVDLSKNVATGIPVDLTGGVPVGLGQLSEDFTNSFRDTLTNIEAVYGSPFPDTLRGDAGDNLFIGRAGADTIDGRRGFDTVTYDSGALGAFPAVDGIRNGLVAGTGVVTVDLINNIAIDDFGTTDTLISIENVIVGPGSDRIIGNGEDNDLSGAGGDDTIDGGEGKNTLDGGDGDDSLTGGNDLDVIRGRDGSDTIFGQDGLDLLYGDGDGDEIHGGDGPDRIFGDVIAGREENGEDTLFGDGGDDELRGYDGNDTLEGGAGKDTLYGGDGSDVLKGGAKADTLFGGGGPGDDDDDGDGENTLKGGAGNDELHGGDLADTIEGGGGADLFFGSGGIDVLDGGKGVDTLSLDGARKKVTVDLSSSDFDGGGFGRNTIRNIEVVLGSDQRDFLTGRRGEEFLSGDGGNDVIDGGLKDDTLIGGSGNDRVEGGGGDDKIVGDDPGDTGRTGPAGNDVLDGGTGNDTIAGGSGDDKLDGGNNADTLDGGAGNDELTGGGGDDVFVFGEDTTRILDFDLDRDVVDLTRTSFATDDLAAGAVVPSRNGKNTILIDPDSGDKLIIIGQPPGNFNPSHFGYEISEADFSI